MNIQPPPLSATSLAQQGINQGFDRLAEHSQSITHTLVENSVTDNPSSVVNKGVNYDALNQLAPETLENSMVNMQQTKVQIQSLAKVIEVENQIIDKSLGKIFDGWA